MEIVSDTVNAQNASQEHPSSHFLQQMEDLADDASGTSKYSFLDFVPTLVVALLMMAFLIASFIRYHRRLQARREALLEYIEHYIDIQPRSDRKIRSRVGSIRAGSIFYNEDDFEPSPGTSDEFLPTQDSVGTQSAGLKGQLLSGNRLSSSFHYETEDSDQAKIQQDVRTEHIRLSNKQTERSKGNIGNPEKRHGHTRKSKRKMVKTQRRHSLDLPDISAIDGLHVREESSNRRVGDLELHNYRPVPTIDEHVLRSHLAKSHPNINSDNFPFFAEEVGQRDSGYYRSGPSYGVYGQVATGYPAPRMQRQVPLVTTPATMATAYECLRSLRTESPGRPGREPPPLTHCDSEEQPSGRVNFNLPYL